MHNYGHSWSFSLSLCGQGRRESLPTVHQVVRRRFSGPLLLPPLWRRHSCQEHPCESRLVFAAHALPLDRLEVLYSRALASRDEHRSVTHKPFFPSFRFFFFSKRWMFFLCLVFLGAVVWVCFGVDLKHFLTMLLHNVMENE